MPVVCGEEVQVNDSPDVGAHDPRKTGSIYGFADLDATRSNAVERYPTLGAWHTMEVRTVGQQYTVLVDGKLINQWDGAVPMSFPDRGLGDPPTMARQFAAGYIGLQDHQDGDVIEYRNVRVKELSAAPKNTAAPVVTRRRLHRPCADLHAGHVEQRRPGATRSTGCARTRRPTTRRPTRR